MRIFIAGGTGFIGRAVTERLLEDGHSVTILTRAQREFGELLNRVSFRIGDPTREGAWQESVGRSDVIINLAGTSIFGRWTEAKKKELFDSRLLTTRHIVDALKPRSTLINASAVGYYGFHADEELDETAPSGNDFLARLSWAWEAEALKGADKEARVVVARFGIVLGEGGGALAQMLPFFRKGVGGPLGRGDQWLSWIHIRDLADAVVFLMKSPEIDGPVNVCSPNPVRNRDFARALGTALHQPSFFPSPGLFLRAILGEFATVLLKGQRVIPRRLIVRGFDFTYPDLKAALDDVLGNRAQEP